MPFGFSENQVHKWLGLYTSISLDWLMNVWKSNKKCRYFGCENVLKHSGPLQRSLPFVGPSFLHGYNVVLVYFLLSEWAQLVKKYSDWWLHINLNWIDMSLSRRVLAIHYEDLQANAYGELEKMLKFLNVTPVAKRLQCAIQEYPASDDTGWNLSSTVNGFIWPITHSRRKWGRQLTATFRGWIRRWRRTTKRWWRNTKMMIGDKTINTAL